MKNFIRNNKYLIVALALAIISVGVVRQFGFNMSSSFNDSFVFQISKDSDGDWQELLQQLQDIEHLDKIEIVSDQELRLFLQGPTTEEFDKIVALSTQTYEESSLQEYYNSPGKINLINERIQNVFVLSAAVLILFLILSFRKVGFSYAENIVLISSEILVFALQILLASAYLSVYSAQIKAIDYVALKLVLISLGMLLPLKVFIFLMLKDQIRNIMKADLLVTVRNTMKLIQTAYLRTGIAMFVILIVLPLVLVFFRYWLLLPLVLIVIGVEVWAIWNLRIILQSKISASLKKAKIFTGFLNKKW